MTVNMLDNYIEENLKRITHEMGEAAVRCGRDPAHVRLMAVTKTVAPEQVNRAVDWGIRLLGENKAQELCEKYDQYRKDDVSIHFIGHLQTNKVRQIADKVDVIHSLDSLKLAKEIDKQCAKLNKVMGVLVEVNIAGEESKSGVLPGQVEELIREAALFSHLRVQGLMAIPPIFNNSQQNEAYFAQMQQLLVDIKGKKIDNVDMDILSMGMSDDFAYAIKHGSNIVRIGTAIFGARDYGAR